MYRFVFVPILIDDLRLSFSLIETGWHVLFILRGFYDVLFPRNPFTYSRIISLRSTSCGISSTRRLVSRHTYRNHIYSYRIGDYYSFSLPVHHLSAYFTPMCIGHQCKVMEKGKAVWSGCLLLPGMCIQLVYPEFYGYICSL